MSKQFQPNALVEAPSAKARDLAKGRVVAAMCLDRSGSMMGESTIQLLEGAADFLEDLREVKQPVVLSFDQFANNPIRDTFEAVTDKPYLTRQRYKAGGGTSIYDGIWDVIAHVEAEKRPQDKAVVVIFTDGQEGRSQHTVSDTRTRVLEKRTEGWEFYFLGPDKKFAHGVGIPHTNVFKLGDAKGLRGALAQMCQTVVRGLLAQSNTVIEL